MLAFDRELENFYAEHRLHSPPGANSSVAWLALAGGYRDHLVPAHLALLDPSYPVCLSLSLSHTHTHTHT